MEGYAHEFGIELHMHNEGGVAQSVEYKPSNREIRVQLSAEESHSRNNLEQVVNLRSLRSTNRVDKLVPALAGGHKSCVHLWG